MTARRARRLDIEEIVRLAGGLFTELNAQPPGPGWHHAARTALHARLEDRDLAVFVIDHPDRAGQLVALAAGFVTVRLPTAGNPSGRVGYVQWVVTDPAWRHRGCARQALTALLAWFDASGIHMDELHTSPEAQRLYTSLGFTETAHPCLRRIPDQE